MRLSIKNISKEFYIGRRRKRTVFARILDSFHKDIKKKILVLDNVSFDVKSGEILGLIGDNGSGKSTLLRIISKIILQDKGDVSCDGNIVSLLNLNIGLKDRLTMGDNIFLLASLFGMSSRQVRHNYRSILNFSELGEFENTRLYQFSSGMRQRLIFSIAIHANPEILLLDEVFEVGDEDFKKRSAKKIKELVRKGCSVILVSHEMWMIEKYCDRVILLENGKIKLNGDAKKVILGYRKND